MSVEAPDSPRAESSALRCELGLGDRASRLTPQSLSDLPEFRQVMAGAGHTCALTPQGQVWCWGEPGRTGVTMPRRALPNDVMFGDVRQISAGGQGTCAVTTGGGVHCWGGGHIVPDGTLDHRTLPPTNPDQDTVAEVRVGNRHSCALQASGQVQCWGSNAFEQVCPRTDGCGDEALTATTVAGLPRGVTSIEARASRSCAIAGGVPWCWGRELGSNGPARLLGLSGIAQVTLGAAATDSEVDPTLRTHGCVRTNEGAVMCWGDNERGQVGVGVTLGQAAPVAVVW